MKLFDFLNDIEFKGNKLDIIIKWVIGGSIAAVGGAFLFGKVISKHLNKLDHLETLTIESIEGTELLKREMNENFKEVNAKIDQVYNDGITSFEDYRKFNNEQLKIIIDHGQENKELVKKMLELNSKEKSIEIQSNLEKSKRNIKNGFEIYPTKSKVFNVSKNVMEYYINGASEDYLDTLNLDNYEIIEKKENKKYKGLFDFKYIEKK